MSLRSANTRVINRCSVGGRGRAHAGFMASVPSVMHPLVLKYLRRDITRLVRLHCETCGSARAAGIGWTVRMAHVWWGGIT